MTSTRWLPLESNPDVMNKFLHDGGVPSEWGIVDVIDLDALQSVPQPVVAVLLLFPGGDQYESFCQEEAERIQSDGQTVSDGIYFMNQVIKNACGTIALIHSIANNADKIQMDEESVLKRFIDQTRDLPPEERGQELEKFDDIVALHEASAQEGQTEAPDAEEDVNLHFVTFVCIDGNLYELDGRKSVPINHGSCSDETLLEDASKVCKSFMERDPENVNFTVLALTSVEA
ncbi:ubiquitin carboxyl-terminal hydrolase isozyme L3-like [Centruroides vittatus]|uniref:ubiquitin carboxyl-terminal hydrolase isozyme L3-like n=1 Tax=Centruroides vittatus TaxID=120091 RepID=UPI00350FE7E4